MNNSINEFELELNVLLKDYFSDEELNRLNMKIIPPKERSDKIAGMINDFYKSQLQIEINNYSERYKIDKTITYSGKIFQSDKFYNFLLDLSRLCLSRGRLNLANELFKKVNKNSNSNVFKAEALIGLAEVFSRRANWQRGLLTIEEAESLYRKLNDDSGLAKCENMMGSIHGERGDIARAKAYFLSALSLLNPETDLELAGLLEMNLGILETIRDNFDDSIKHLTKALVSFNKLGNSRRISEIKHNIGYEHFKSGDHESALAAFDEAIELAKQGSFISILCVVYLSKSQVLVAMDDLYYASKFADKALDISNSNDDKLTSADSYRVKGIIERRRKNYSDAETFLLNSLRMNKSLKNEKNVAETSFELAVLYDEKNNSQSKKPYLTSALNYFKKINAFKEVKKIKEMMGVGTA